jgi:hypothetical protein
MDFILEKKGKEIGGLEDGSIYIDKLLNVCMLTSNGTEILMKHCPGFSNYAPPTVIAHDNAEEKSSNSVESNSLPSAPLRSLESTPQVGLCKSADRTAVLATISNLSRVSSATMATQTEKRNAMDPATFKNALPVVNKFNTNRNGLPCREPYDDIDTNHIPSSSHNDARDTIVDNQYINAHNITEVNAKNNLLINADNNLLIKDKTQCKEQNPSVFIDLMRKDPDTLFDYRESDQKVLENDNDENILHFPSKTQVSDEKGTLDFCEKETHDVSEPLSEWYRILPLALIALNNTNYSRLGIQPN